MRLSRFGLAFAAAQCLYAFAPTAHAAECKRFAAAGDGLTKDIAVVMSTHGLQNIIEDKGMKGQGPVKTTCSAGTIMTECRSSQLACK
jgi:hypothetical protein